MSEIVQLYSDKTKTTKVYPKTLASETYMNNGGTVESQLAQIENKNIEQDNRLKEVDRVNKTQQVYINGLFNENKDGRLSVEGEGNSLKLEGSKNGLVEVDRIVGNTLVNLCNKDSSENIILKGASKTSLVFTPSYTLLEELFLEVKCLNNTADYTLGIIFIVVYKDSTNNTEYFSFINATTTLADGLGIGRMYRTFTPKGEIDYIKIQLHSENSGTSIATIKDVKLYPKSMENSFNNVVSFAGLQSSFEENLVTQEMINEGLESEENLGKYKVPVKLIGKNKLSDLQIGQQWQCTCKAIGDGGFIIKPTSTEGVSYVIINTSFLLKKEKNYVFSPNAIDASTYNKSYIWSVNNTTVIQFPLTEDTPCRIAIYVKNNNLNNELIVYPQIEEGTVATDYEEYFERTTNVYLNSPHLKGDEIVMKDGELCHYHKRDKIVFDGSNDEKWGSISMLDNTLFTQINVKHGKGDFICDNFIYRYVWDEDIEGVFTNGIGNNYSSFHFRINKSKLSTLDLIGWKAWLQSNPTTIVYPIAEPYYEPIQANKILLECANDSTLYIDSIVPVESVKASYTSGVPSVYALEETNNNQDSLIDISLCATDEMYMMLEPLLEAIPQTLNNERMISKNSLGEFYLAMVQRNLKAVDEVPLSFREYVLEKLKNS